MEELHLGEVEPLVIFFTQVVLAVVARQVLAVAVVVRLDPTATVLTVVRQELTAGQVELVTLVLVALERQRRVMRTANQDLQGTSLATEWALAVVELAAALVFQAATVAALAGAAAVTIRPAQAPARKVASS